MNVRHTIVHTFSVSQAEIKTILKALKDSSMADAHELAKDIEKHVERSNRDVQRRFQTQHTVHCRNEEENDSDR